MYVHSETVQAMQFLFVSTVDNQYITVEYNTILTTKPQQESNNFIQTLNFQTHSYLVITGKNSFVNTEIVCIIIGDHPLKQKCRDIDEIFSSGCTRKCQNSNFQRSQPWKSIKLTTFPFHWIACVSMIYTMPNKVGDSWFLDNLRFVVHPNITMMS